ncbi:hypothetical protein ABK040_015606 [Willaertia magna]
MRYFLLLAALCLFFVLLVGQCVHTAGDNLFSKKGTFKLNENKEQWKGMYELNNNNLKLYLENENNDLVLYFERVKDNLYLTMFTRQDKNCLQQNLEWNKKQFKSFKGQFGLFGKLVKLFNKLDNLFTKFSKYHNLNDKEYSIELDPKVELKFNNSLNDLQSSCVSFPKELTNNYFNKMQNLYNQHLNKKLQSLYKKKKETLYHKIELKDNNATKVCVFLHGAGNKYVSPTPTHSFPHYWGKMENYTPQCKELWFIMKNTRLYGWTSDELQREYCQLALINSKPNTKLVTNTIIFTHSMANLILPAAIHKGYCDIDLKTSSWYAISGPFNGTKAATVLNTLCYDYVHRTAPSNMQKIYDFIAEVTGYCDGDQARPSDVNLIPGFCDVNKTSDNNGIPSGLCLGKQIYEIAKKRIKGRMCGFNPLGLITPYGAALEALSTIVNYGELNDGMVPISSCAMDLNTIDDFGLFPSDLNYHADENHADVTCRNGNGLSSTKKACDYYTNKN